MAQRQAATSDTFAWATRPGRDSLSDRFDATWWYDAAQQYADSLEDPGNSQSFQKHWIGQTPDGGRADGQAAHGRPGLAPSRARRRPRWPSARIPATAASARSTSGCSTPVAAAGPTGQGEEIVFGLTTSIQSIGEGNYGRLGPGSAAALHARAGRDDVLRARDRRDAGRAARCDA